MKKLQKFFICALHIALVLIVIGGLVTAFTAKYGEIHFRLGEEKSQFEQEDGSTVSLPFTLRLDRFDIKHHPGTQDPKDYVSSLTILPQGEEVVISMNHILKYKGYRFYQADYDEDRCGSILAVSRDPWGIAICYTGFALLLLSMLGWFLLKGGWPRSAIVAGAVVCIMPLLWLLIAGTMGKNWRSMPVLNTPLLTVHVLSVMTSYLLFAVAAITGIIGLAASKKAEKMQRFSITVLHPAVFLLSFGIIIGSVWANVSWGRYWGWDPKETWALITLIMYALVLHAVSFKWFRKPWQYHLATFLAFFFVLFTWFGVNYLLSGMHSYA